MVKKTGALTPDFLIGMLLTSLITLSACSSIEAPHPGAKYGLSKSEWVQLKKAGGGTCPSLIEGEISQLRRNN